MRIWGTNLTQKQQLDRTNAKNCKTQFTPRDLSSIQTKNVYERIRYLIQPSTPTRSFFHSLLDFLNVSHSKGKI